MLSCHGSAQQKAGLHAQLPWICTTNGSSCFSYKSGAVTMKGVYSSLLRIPSSQIWSREPASVCSCQGTFIATQVISSHCQSFAIALASCFSSKICCFFMQLWRWSFRTSAAVCYAGSRIKESGQKAVLDCECTPCHFGLRMAFSLGHF